MAHSLPAIVPAPVRGEFTGTAQRSLGATTQQPVSTNRNSAEAIFARLEAVSLCPPTIKPGLERPEDLTQVLVLYLFDLLSLFYVNIPDILLLI